MPKGLIIVESPAKAKTVERMLGGEYRVKASMGHIRDLPKSKLGVDVENNYKPHYITIRGKSGTIRELKEAVKDSGKVLLATDPDREGEAISWHLTQALDLNCDTPCRIEFHEITERAVRNALANPRPIHMDRVNAQQARRILDRLVGYTLSPFLWKKVRRGLSAGRVQSVAVKLICDREKEIEDFVKEEYWSITAFLKAHGDSLEFPAKLLRRAGKKVQIGTADEAWKILKDLEGAEYQVSKVAKKERKRNPQPPFTTSTLQQEASRKLRFGARKTMQIAQQLYEGLEIGPEGTVGLITYIRTDSVRVASEAEAAARSFITGAYGKDYVPQRPRRFKVKAASQDAHEAIRPTLVTRRPDDVKKFLSEGQFKLYKLIWDRFVASQMESAVLDTVSVDIKAKNYLFRATGSRIKFPGFTVLYQEGSDNPEEDDPVLPEISEGQKLLLSRLEDKQHFTEPPPRYTEATLVRALEENGIGRPSTYAPIIETIIRREYVVLEDRRFRPTKLGFVVVDVLNQVYPNVVDVAFTANMEDRLDKIAEGELEWESVIDEFYRPFKETVETAHERVEKVKIPEEVTDELCPECGRNLVVKHGRFGAFLGCQGYPECKFTKRMTRSTGVKCPKCGSEIVERKTKRGRKFYGCSGYPECTFSTWYTPVKKSCPKCGAFLVKRGGKKGYLACVKEDCDFREGIGG
ncbi:MAG: type I DNA topoisomerase [Bacillota bacterium]|jgi:DNA topoisomerase-1|nr:type I DNA topoisomerase [Bacillota bacterium]